MLSGISQHSVLTEDDAENMLEGNLKMVSSNSFSSRDALTGLLANPSALSRHIRVSLIGNSELFVVVLLIKCLKCGE